MSKILLINLSSLPMPGNEPIYPIGVRCIQQALDLAGHRTLVVDFVETPQAFDDLTWASGDWDVIGFAIRNIDPIGLAREGHIDDYLRFTNRVKAVANPNAVLVGGGPGYSLFADSLTELLGLHVGVRGPGETVMLEIANDPGRYKLGPQVIDGQRYEGFITEPLTHQPNLVRVYANDRLSMIGVETRRKTCFQRCVYCPYAYITGQNSGDLKPLELLRAEISGIYDAGFRRIFFTDGIFNSGITFAKQIVRMLTEQRWPGLTWSAYFAARPFDEEFAELLRYSGVESVVVSPDSLDGGLMERLGKNFDLAAMDKFVEICRRHSLRMSVNVVFGGPDESRETVANTARYINEKLASDELSMHVGYRILPHTSLSAETGLNEKDLLYPTFYPFDPDLFKWANSDLDKRFMTNSRMLNLLAGRASLLRMAKITQPQSQNQNACGAKVIAFSRAPVPTKVGS
ncbi:B12-binding domain-containing radical SAM protein [Paucibacter sp. KCTC 42545]|uniref:B12-binding domain-containing radical SAM protein n=1 Tax=Paucibacter sp. KCTC 42545 TaxID=1768242 RepID=UPI000733C4C3|nr:radical SAM protein [Paucibacter sp. KCTC 42545]ALT79267.1 hypothetical protein AT984_20785 [Paucibacter sp. KCTC 42545]